MFFSRIFSRDQRSREAKVKFPVAIFVNCDITVVMTTFSFNDIFFLFGLIVLFRGTK